MAAPYRGRSGSGPVARDTPAGMAFDTHAAVKTLTVGGTDEALAGGGGRGRARGGARRPLASGWTRGHFDTALASSSLRKG